MADACSDCGVCAIADSANRARSKKDEGRSLENLRFIRSNVFAEITSVKQEPRIASLSLYLDGLKLLNVVGGSLPVPGTCDNQVFVIAIAQGRIRQRMAAINCNEEQPLRITLVPYVTIFARVLVLGVRPSRAEVFFFIEVFQFTLQELVHDTPDMFRFIAQDVCNATSPSVRPKRKRQPM